MSKTIRLFVHHEGDVWAAFSESRIRELADEQVKASGLPFEEALTAIYGDTGRWHTITVKDAIKETDRAVKSKARRFDDKLGYVIDDDLWGGALVEAATEGWDFPAERSMKGLDSLPIPVSAAIEGAINEHLYGSLTPFFLKLSSFKPPTSGGATN